MRIAYLDCSSGISGNMILGAMIDSGLAIDDLKRQLEKLDLPGYKIKAYKVVRRHIAGTFVKVTTEDLGIERHLQDILEIIEDSSLSRGVKDNSGAAFRRLAHAEAGVHGLDVEDIHFHEVGATDAIVDVVGSMIGIETLGIEAVYSSAVHLGTGFVKCAHGMFPVPAPATLSLVKGVPTYGRDVEAELTTPTGAAILTTLATQYGKAPRMTIDSIGYGAGSRDLPIPNLLRISIGESSAGEGSLDEDRITVVEANIDDMNPELYDHVMRLLLDRGALDVFLTPIQMKRNRPAVKLSVLTRPGEVDRVFDVLFAETTTLGARFYDAARKKLIREIIQVDTRYGTVRVKLGKVGEAVRNVSPEYEDCRCLAQERDVPLKTVYDAAKRAATDALG